MNTLKADFFIMCPLGAQDLTAMELQHILSQWDHTLESTSAALSPGGIELSLPINLGAQLPLHLKSATRVLWRLAKFRARDFAKVFQKAQKLQWKEWTAGTKVVWKVSTEQSRLMHTDRLAETLNKALESYWKHWPPTNKKRPGLRRQFLHA